MDRIQIFGLFGGILLLLLVLELVRRRKLLEGYSLIWILTCLGLIVVSLWKNLWEKLADFLGIFYSPVILFLFTFAFLLLIVLDLTIKISKLTDQNRKLAQRTGLKGIKGNKRIKGSRGSKGVE